MDDNKHYGIYRGTCYDNSDPQNLNRIKVICPQVLSTTPSNWASSVNPVIGNANHPDHVAHTAAQVAALLTSHSISGTTGSSSSGNAHTHTFSATAAHAGGSGTLTHPHTTSVDPLETDGSELGLTAAEHTYHRLVPNIGQGVWVMFEGGDVNFPVWLGVF
jgi:hypothetical protein